MILILQNKDSVTSTVKVDGVVVDEEILASGQPNVRVIEINGNQVEVNGFTAEIEGDLLFNFESNEFELR